MSDKTTEFYPFFDPYRDGNQLSYTSKVGICVGTGLLFNVVQYLAVADAAVYFDLALWILGAIMSTCMLALYVATDVFRKSLNIINEFEGDNRISQNIVSVWLSDRTCWIAGLAYATINTTNAHLLGIPAVFHESVFSLVVMYIGFFLAGLAAGMGLWGILAIIVLYLKFAPNLQHSLDPSDPDGTGGIKKLGDALWFFAMLTGAVGLLVSIYMFGIEWAYMYKPYVRFLFVLWIALPYLVAISVVLIPGLAVRRQVAQYKAYKAEQLKQEKARVYSEFKDFEEADDDAIIASKKELNDRLAHIQEQMEKLRKMRNSHIDSGE